MSARGHLTRDESFLLVGLLVADADGKRLPVEVDTILDALERRSGKVADAGRRLVQQMAADVRSRGLTALIGEVSRGLPKPEDRTWAFGLAVEVAFADRFLHPNEVDHIVELGEALHLAEDDLYAIANRR